MEHKKKLKNILKYFLRISKYSLLLMALLSFSSLSNHCYANISEEYVNWFIDSVYNDSYYSSQNRYCFNKVLSTEGQISSITSRINQYLSDNNLSNLNEYNLISFVQPTDDYSPWLRFVFSNCSFPNGVNHIGYLDYYKTKIRCANPSDYPNDYIVVIGISLNSSGFKNYNYFTFGSVYFNTSYLSTYQTFLDHTITINYVYNYSPTQSIYVTADDLNSYYLLNNSNHTYLNVYPPEPDEPSGDTPVEPSGDTPVEPSGDSGGGSVIDYTNQLNNINTSINNIQNQMSGDTQKVIDNQNNNTQTIVNAISGETQKITNILTNEPNLSNITITSGDIERCFRF